MWYYLLSSRDGASRDAARLQGQGVSAEAAEVAQRLDGAREADERVAGLQAEVVGGAVGHHRELVAG